MNERETEQNVASEELEQSRHSILSFFPRIFGQFSSLAWGGAALIIILSFSFLLWINSADSSREVVQTFDSELSSELNFPLPVQTPIKEEFDIFDELESDSSCSDSEKVETGLFQTEDFTK
jgi:hypothetical protein